MANGLSYLHDNGIIYRDLKPDNVLVMSYDIKDVINVKLSDYGISKFSTLQGLTGMFGTVGYMAPEVTAKEAYTNKVVYLVVDVFEILTNFASVCGGHGPLADGHVSGSFQTWLLSGCGE